MNIVVNTNQFVHELLDELCRANLIESLELIKDNNIGIPIFSTDPEVEEKEVKKLIKAFERVLDWYRSPAEWKYFK